MCETVKSHSRQHSKHFQQHLMHFRSARCIEYRIKWNYFRTSWIHYRLTFNAPSTTSVHIQYPRRTFHYFRTLLLVFKFCRWRLNSFINCGRSARAVFWHVKTSAITFDHLRYAPRAVAETRYTFDGSPRYLRRIKCLLFLVHFRQHSTSGSQVLLSGNVNTTTGCNRST